MSVPDQFGHYLTRKCRLLLVVYSIPTGRQKSQGAFPITFPNQILSRKALACGWFAAKPVVSHHRLRINKRALSERTRKQKRPADLKSSPKVAFAGFQNGAYMMLRTSSYRCGHRRGSLVSLVTMSGRCACWVIVDRGLVGAGTE
jgi:hypothetical protein